MEGAISRGISLVSGANIHFRKLGTSGCGKVGVWRVPPGGGSCAPTGPWTKTEAKTRIGLIEHQAETMLSQLSRNYIDPLLLKKKRLGEAVAQLGEISFVIEGSSSAPDLGILTQTEGIFEVLKDKVSSTPAATGTAPQFIPAVEESTVGSLTVRSPIGHIKPMETKTKIQTEPKKSGILTALKGLGRRRPQGPVCNHCNRRSQHVWYKCGMCPDFILCSDCEKIYWNDGFPHEVTHIFLKMHAKGHIKDTSVEPLIPSDVFTADNLDTIEFVCDRCSAPIHMLDKKTAHYRCTMCNDYDLCETCEMKEHTQDGIHFEDHIFAKLDVLRSSVIATFMVKYDTFFVPLLNLREHLENNEKE